MTRRFAERSAKWFAVCTRAAAVALLCAASGCFSVRYSEGSELRHERVKDIVPGVTTRTQVLDWFGAPESFSSSALVNNLAESMQMSPQDVLQLPFADSMIFRFTKGRMKAKFFGIWNSVDVRVTADTLVVFFDEQDKVSSYGYRRGTDDLDAKPGAKPKAEPGAGSGAKSGSNSNSNSDARQADAKQE